MRYGVKRGEMKIKPQTEKEITQSIRMLLRTFGIFHWKVWQGLGSQKGVSDIIGIHDGKFFAIEIKTKKGRVNIDQKHFIDMVNMNGGIGFIARSVDDVMEKLHLGAEIFIKVNKQRRVK